MTRLLSVFIDAWEQLRLQRVRVLMSLIGVTLAVAALTASLALGNIMAKVQDEMSIRQAGPEATYMLYANGGGEQPPSEDLIAALREAADRYGITYATPVISFDPVLPQFSGYASGFAVDPAFFPMHARTMEDGRALVPQDADRLAPVGVISRGLADALGIQSVAGHPTVQVGDVRVAVVGITANQWDVDASLYVLPESYQAHFAVTAAEEGAYGQSANIELKIWIPADADPDALAARVARDIAATQDGLRVSAERIDAGAYADFGPDPAVITTIVLASVSVAILALGALSLINIAVVTVRYRIREFGIRRAFGASQRRIFVGVMMESVVGTFVAGIVGVGIVAVVYRSPWAQDMFGTAGVVGLPPFPVEAAVVGILTSILTGAVAGMIPAVIAVRSKVIDAIRF